MEKYDFWTQNDELKRTEDRICGCCLMREATCGPCGFT